MAVGGFSRATANEWRGFFFSGLSSEVVIFPKNDSHDMLLAPTIGFNGGYQAKSFAVTGGTTYYFYNFYGARDLVMHFGVDYKLRLNIGGNNFSSFGLGANIARNTLTGYVRGDKQVIYFFIPTASIDINIGKFVVSIASKVYVPIESRPEVAYSIGGMLGIGF